MIQVGSNSRRKYRIAHIVYSLVLVAFLSAGGCDVDFGGTDNGNSGGGGGGGNTDRETVQGTIVDIIPNRDIEGITVEVMADDSLNTTFSDVTNSSGFFQITGRFSGSPQLDFIDQDDNSLGLVIINVFPTARVDLGNISLENGTVFFEEETDVTFEGDIILNNCEDNAGALEVEAVNGEDELEILVQVTGSTDVVRTNGDDIPCQNLLIGQTVEIRGIVIIGNSVDASRVELL